MDALAAIPSARLSAATVDTTGAFASMRSPYFRSCKSIPSSPFRSSSTRGRPYDPAGTLVSAVGVEPIVALRAD